MIAGRWACKCLKSAALLPPRVPAGLLFSAFSSLLSNPPLPCPPPPRPLPKGCPSWHSLTATTYHFASQPLPTPLAWAAHHLPLHVHKAAVALTLWAEGPLTLLLLCPIPGPRHFAAVLQARVSCVCACVCVCVFPSPCPGLLP